MCVPTRAETGNAMVKRSGVPPGRGVAVRTIRRRKRCPGAGVDRRRGLLPFREVTTGIAAVGGRNLQVVVAVDVAGRARDVGVAVRQQESSGAVIENGRRPARTVLWQVAQFEAANAVPAVACGRIVGLLPLG